jgi:FAD/FMN-containing dehydrogenase/Fe-S oxidoreductase
LAVESVSADLVRELERCVEGEVRFDTYSRILYSTDASIYQIVPLGVVLPRHRAAAVEAVRFAVRHHLPVLARGGGTSLSGQAVGEAIILDFSKYMRRILEFNPEERWVRVEPGVIQDELNAFLKPHGFGLGPDTSSSSRVTLGGMIGNNSAGSHSILYGKTIDHVLELRVVLADGSEAVFAPTGAGELERRAAGDSFESRLYREVSRIGRAYEDEIRRRYPKLIRRVSGYNLDEFVPNGDCFGAGYSSPPGPFNLARAIVGSEGTLAVVTEAKIRVVPLPKATGIGVINFATLVEAVEAAPELVRLAPAAVELMDKRVLDGARRARGSSKGLEFADPDAEGNVVVEFFGDSEAEVRARLDALKSLVQARRIGYGHLFLTDPAAQQAVWNVRKEAMGLLMGVVGDRKPIAFVEDPAVPIENYPDFLRGFERILRHYDAEGGYYGHASVGCLHIRPLINIKDPAEVAKMRRIAEEVFELVVAHGGSMSGEHGDGLARGKFNERLFGPVIYQAFVELKRAFDPENLMNPGKVVHCPEMTENLRYPPGYRILPVETYFDYSAQGGFAGAIEMCNGNGACRKTLGGVMCPSYMATLEEEHSTRGRANALRAALSGLLAPEEFTSPRMYEVLDLCLACKGCKRECPSNVDLAKLKSEFLAHSWKRHGVPLRARLMARIGQLNRWGSRLAPVANVALASAPARWVMERMLGIDRRRRLPSFAGTDFETWFRRRPRPAPNGRGRVVLFHDCFTTYNYPEVGRAATELLEHAGFEVILLQHACCGRPAISKGLLEEARRLARDNLAALLPWVQRGVPVLGCEPSCLLTFRDEYPELVPGEAARRLAGGAWLIDEFLVKREDLRLTWDGAGRKVLFHGHCHQKAHVGTAATLQLLRSAGCEVREIDAGCCGMAGSFGFEKEHYAISEAIARRRLIPAVEAAGEDTEIAVTGVSCRQQIAHFSSRRPRHVVEILRSCLSTDRSAS